MAKNDLSDRQKTLINYGLILLGGVIVYNKIFGDDESDKVTDDWLKNNNVERRFYNLTREFNSKISGPNARYYPQVINGGIVPLTADELRQINLVWDTFFSSLNNGLTLRLALIDEDYLDPLTFFTQHGYQPAIDHLKNNGF